MSQYRNTCVQVTLILLNNGPKVQERWANNYDMSKRSRKVLSLNEKVKVLNLPKKRDCMWSLLRPMVVIFNRCAAGSVQARSVSLVRALISFPLGCLIKEWQRPTQQYPSSVNEAKLYLFFVIYFLACCRIFVVYCVMRWKMLKITGLC